MALWIIYQTYVVDWWLQLQFCICSCHTNDKFLDNLSGKGATPQTCENDYFFGKRWKWKAGQCECRWTLLLPQFLMPDLLSVDELHSYLSLGPCFQSLNVKEKGWGGGRLGQWFWSENAHVANNYIWFKVRENFKNNKYRNYTEVGNITASQQYC